MMPFIHRNPNAAEEQLLALMLATFTDGSGTQRESDGASRAGWKEIERVFSEFWTGEKHSEDKDVFDVIAPDWNDPGIQYGVSIKSKQMTGRRTVFNGDPEARAYLELSNSPAKMWASIKSYTGFTESHFSQRQNPQEIGEALMRTIAGWKTTRAAALEHAQPGVKVDLARSYYVTLSWSPYEDGHRCVQISSFPMQFPSVQWRYTSDRCLSADDPLHPGERLLDWYAMSGGQLKFYPRYTTAHYASTILKISKVEEISIAKKALTYFPDEFQFASENLDRKQLLLLNRLISTDVTGVS